MTTATHAQKHWTDKGGHVTTARGTAGWAIHCTEPAPERGLDRGVFGGIKPGALAEAKPDLCSGARGASLSRALFTETRHLAVSPTAGVPAHRRRLDFTRPKGNVARRPVKQFAAQWTPAHALASGCMESTWVACGGWSGAGGFGSINRVATGLWGQLCGPKLWLLCGVGRVSGWLAQQGWPEPAASAGGLLITPMIHLLLGLGAREAVANHCLLLPASMAKQAWLHIGGTAFFMLLQGWLVGSWRF